MLWRAGRIIEGWLDKHPEFVDEADDVWRMAYQLLKLELRKVEGQFHFGTRGDKYIAVNLKEDR